MNDYESMILIKKNQPTLIYELQIALTRTAFPKGAPTNLNTVLQT